MSGLNVSKYFSLLLLFALVRGENNHYLLDSSLTTRKTKKNLSEQEIAFIVSNQFPDDDYRLLNLGCVPVALAWYIGARYGWQISGKTGSVTISTLITIPVQYFFSTKISDYYLNKLKSIQPPKEISSPGDLEMYRTILKNKIVKQSHKKTSRNCIIGFLSLYLLIEGPASWTFPG